MPLISAVELDAISIPEYPSPDFHYHRLKGIIAISLCSERKGKPNSTDISVQKLVFRKAKI